MKIEQIYTGCLAQGAYFIQSDNEAAIIDPLQEVRPYLEECHYGRAYWPNISYDRVQKPTVN